MLQQRNSNPVFHPIKCWLCSHLLPFPAQGITYCAPPSPSCTKSYVPSALLPAWLVTRVQWGTEAMCVKLMWSHHRFGIATQPLSRAIGQLAVHLKLGVTVLLTTLQKYLQDPGRASWDMSSGKGWQTWWTWRDVTSNCVGIFGRPQGNPTPHMHLHITR